ncbi:MULTISPECIES: hypothetical protein [Pseudomonas]|uniref:hypothetical protein n=1 Tax=Pseudomonas TaxID=286 RepID=UPI0015DED891|nr:MULTISPECIES: hypothetical protein [Pseudomonas]QLL11719.1 hypothetical protein H0I86_22200 [Pseudomonas chlororaphis subsp. aurantiaca]WJV25897.1 hypothetical protein PSR66_07675 [Pseudomonas chlororaphis]
MSDFKVRQTFEEWFAQKHLAVTGDYLSDSEMAKLRGEKGDYDHLPYMHGCWLGWAACAGLKPKSKNGEAQ